MKPKRGTYQIALRTGGFEEVSGWVVDGWAAHKEKWFWEFTRVAPGKLTHGQRASFYPPVSRLDEALVKLELIAGLDVSEARAAWSNLSWR